MNIILILKLIFSIVSIGFICSLLREIIKKKPSKYSDLQKIFGDKKRIVRWYVWTAIVFEIMLLVIKKVGIF